MIAQISSLNDSLVEKLNRFRYVEVRRRRHTILAGEVLFDKHALAVGERARVATTHRGQDTGVAGAGLGR